jgi:hypothetical protein
VKRGIPQLIDEDIPSHCCVMTSPYLYSAQNVSGIFIRNEYVHAVNDLVAFCKGEKFARNADNSEGSNDGADMAVHGGGVGPDGDTIMGTSAHEAESSVLTPFPMTIGNPFRSPLPRRKAGVIITGSPGIGKYNRVGCVVNLTHSI